MNATSLGLTNISFSDVQTGTAPKSMKYQGTCIAYTAGKTKASNQAILKKSVWKAISNMKTSGAYATSMMQLLVLFIISEKDKASGADTRFEKASSALKATNCWNQKVASGNYGGQL